VARAQPGSVPVSVPSSPDQPARRAGVSRRESVLPRTGRAGPAPRGGLRGDFPCAGSPRLAPADSFGPVRPGGLGLTGRLHPPGTYSLRHRVTPRGGSAAARP
jgi:hypothetical protein